MTDEPDLGPQEREIALAFARAILPDGRVFHGGDEATVARMSAMVRERGAAAMRGVGALLRALDAAAVLRTGRPFRRLDDDARESLLRRWEDDRLLRWPLFGLAFLFKSTHFDDPEVYRAMGCVYRHGGPPEPARWLSQVRRGADSTAGETIECDAVVVGTGAGGAVVAKELAARGHAVVMLEEGELHRRDVFDGRAGDAHRRFYREPAGLFALGNTFVPILAGRLVGGSTAVNTGTCFRTPGWILDGWCERLQTDDFSPDRMALHFDAVEQELGVEPARAEYLGGAARVVARGCDALGWHHFPLRRNAPECDGSGVCDFGCPTDARRSTNVSYVPAALRRNALLYTGMHARRVLIERGRAVGVEAESTWTGLRIEVRARVVVLAGGAIPSPLLLLEQGICNGSDQVGRNLSVHPATAVSALFEEKIEGYKAIPQGYGCDQFHRQGILLLGASAPLDVGAGMFTFNGRRLMDAMEAYDRVASFGVMVEDEGRGRVRAGRGGRPRVTYWLAEGDVERLHTGMIRVAEIFLAAGARRVYPLLPRHPSFEGRAGLEQLRDLRLRPWDFVLTSFHPLGTCRMGRDPRTSVVATDHETHEVQSLFVIDGSTVPTPPAVNPQITIMAMAHRAAGLVAARLE